ncbi:MAG TPA: hypothetical protein VMZ27_06005 [Candidatus Saccharimonadales bacterium]|nr:hypothetical protein [Candidatus Saccharimonadales bacterium]
MKKILLLFVVGLTLGGSGCVVRERDRGGYYREQHAYYRNEPGYWDRGNYHDRYEFYPGYHHRGDWNDDWRYRR